MPDKIQAGVFLANLGLAGQIPASGLTFGQLSEGPSLQQALCSPSEP